MPWDVAIVGAGPAGAAAALGALRARPGLSVLLLDREEFPRDKPCGDGIAPHATDLLRGVGVTGLVDDRVPMSRLRLALDGATVARDMPRPAWVVPRSVFDARLVEAAVAAGARLQRRRVRAVEALDAAVVVGADGPHSVVRAATGLPRPRMALAIRGYAPTPPARQGEQVIVFGAARPPSYAWSFDRGDGLANVGYGELLSPGRPAPPRGRLLAELERLLPGATEGGTQWRGHHLPMSSWTWRHPDGRLLLAGDAAALVNPMTGEGITYAVATGLLAGRAAAEAVDAGHPERAGAAYRHSARALLCRHLRHSALGALLARREPVLDLVLRAAAARQPVFDDLVELGLGFGTLTPTVLAGLAGSVRKQRGG
ncbi:MAG: NAD(P)/FAD-dependent oxidoreductase [Nocardioidaceae bacterium]